MIQFKRIYELRSEDDGERYLVERLWPRGVSREVAGLTGWLKELAPSPGLRQWFGHDPLRWDEFQQRYQAELRTPERERLLLELAEKAQKGKVTLVFAARDAQHNSAVVLKAFVEERYLGQRALNVEASGGKVANISARPLEWVYRQIVENARDAIIVADTEGVIRLWNSGAEAIFGYNAYEAVGQTLDLIIPERFRQRHWEGYRKVMATGVTRYSQELLAVPSVRKDGTRISLEFTIVLLKGSGGSHMGAAAIMRDVTERWQREKAAAERLAELEAQLVDKGLVEVSQDRRT